MKPKSKGCTRPAMEQNSNRCLKCPPAWTPNMGQNIRHCVSDTAHQAPQRCGTVPPSPDETLPLSTRCSHRRSSRLGRPSDGDAEESSAPCPGQRDPTLLGDGCGNWGPTSRHQAHLEYLLHYHTTSLSEVN